MMTLGRQLDTRDDPDHPSPEGSMTVCIWEQHSLKASRQWCSCSAAWHRAIALPSGCLSAVRPGTLLTGSWAKNPPPASYLLRTISLWIRLKQCCGSIYFFIPLRRKKIYKPPTLHQTVGWGYKRGHDLCSGRAQSGWENQQVIRSLQCMVSDAIVINTNE